MATALLTGAELICFDHDIIKIIRKIKTQHQRADINSTSPEDKLQVYSASEHVLSHLQSPTVLENELFLDNTEKEAKFVNFKNNFISDLTKIISEKIKTELKAFKIESLKQISESLTWYKNETNLLKEECKSNGMIIAKLSKTIENLANRKPK